MNKQNMSEHMHQRTGDYIFLQQETSQLWTELVDYGCVRWLPCVCNGRGFFVHSDLCSTCILPRCCSLQEDSRAKVEAQQKVVQYCMHLRFDMYMYIYIYGSSMSAALHLYSLDAAHYRTSEQRAMQPSSRALQPSKDNATLKQDIAASSMAGRV